MLNAQGTELRVRERLLRIALRNAERSVPLQVVAIFFVAYMGLAAGAHLAAGAMALVGVITGVWRWFSARRKGEQLAFSEVDLRDGERMLEFNAALAGGTWIIGTLGIYPALAGATATSYVVVICGSIAVATFFMGLVGRAFVILVIFQLGGVTLQSLFLNAPGSIELAILLTVFGVTGWRVARDFRSYTTRSVRHELEVGEANNALKMALEGAQAANIAKSQFLATMSHEIRTPMNGVMGALDLLRRSRLDAQQRRLLRTAMSSGENLMSILNDVLDHSKIEAEKLLLASASMSLHDVAASVASLFRSSAEVKGLGLALDIEPGTVNWVLGDALRLKQVLLNLVGNAIKFTERGGVTLSLRPARALNPRCVGVAIEVRDTGIGIPASELQKVFEPFHQAPASYDRRPGGTGLGLAISQRIVQTMGSRIEVISTKGEGSRFRFVLEVEPDPTPDHTPPADSALTGLDDHPMLSGKVLVAEDNDVNRLIASEMLITMGLQVVEASNGAAALEQLDRQVIDLVLMDIQMPVMDGYSATQKIRDREAKLGLPRLPIIALTANAFEEDAACALAAGMDAHLAKPYTFTQLHEVLVSWLQQSTRPE
jgi:two-component system, sensor histidine kinase